jgi:hypothetical protein
MKFKLSIFTLFNLSRAWYSGPMRKSVWMGLAVAGLMAMAVNCAPKPTETKSLNGKIKGKASLRLADGSPISQDGTDEYNPYIVKLSDNYLVLIFGSNRSCGGCSGHNIFIAKSITPYAGLTLPFFNTPVRLTDGGSPLNQSQQINFAATANNANVILYVNDSAGDIQKGTVTNMATPTASFSLIANTGSRPHKIIGVSSSGAEIVTIDSGGTSYTSNPNTTDSPTAYGFGLDSALSATQVRLDNSGYDDSYMAVSSSFGPFSTPIATTKAFPFGPIIDFDFALLSSGLSITHINTLYGDNASEDILLFSANNGGSTDLYVVTSHTSKGLWDEVASFGGETLPPPPPDQWFPFENAMGCNFNVGASMSPWTGTCTGVTIQTFSSYDGSDYGLFASTDNVALGVVDFNPWSAGFTIATWIQFDSSCSSAACTIAAITDTSGVADGFRFFYDGTTGRLKFFTRNASATTAESNTAVISADGSTWHHVAVVANPNDGTNAYAYLYVDGNYVGSTTTADLNFRTDAPVNGYIGRHTGTGDYFVGGMDNFMVFEYELFDEDIAMLAFGL